MTAPLDAIGGYVFQTPERLTAALTHPSFRNEVAAGAVDNQRLEFLGDTVVGLVVSAELFDQLSEQPEGTLSALRARVVSEPLLADAARRLGLPDLLRVGKGVENSGGHQRDSVLCDAFEAVVGAVFLDGGYAAAEEFTLQWLSAPLEDAIATGREASALDGVYRHAQNWKTVLQEWVQGRHEQLPSYRLTGRGGPDHAPEFEVEVSAEINAQFVSARGVGGSKKEAEREAARSLYEQLSGDEEG